MLGGGGGGGGRAGAVTLVERLVVDRRSLLGPIKLPGQRERPRQGTVCAAQGLSLRCNESLVMEPHGHYGRVHDS